jgi:hypothetical protein
MRRLVINHMHDADELALRVPEKKEFLHSFKGPW